MLKRGVLAWFLCRHQWVFDKVDDHRVIIGLGVYEERGGGRNNKLRQTNAITEA